MTSDGEIFNRFLQFLIETVATDQLRGTPGMVKARVYVHIPEEAERSSTTPVSCIPVHYKGTCPRGPKSIYNSYTGTPRTRAYSYIIACLMI